MRGIHRTQNQSTPIIKIDKLSQWDYLKDSPDN